MTVDLEKLSLAELSKLEDELHAAKADRKAQERDAIKAKLAEQAIAAGFTIEELFGKRGKSRGKVAPKYRNPKNASETWTGRGRRPRWLESALRKRGVKLDDFAI